MDNNIKQDAFVQGLEQAAEKYAYIHPTCGLAKKSFIEGGKWMAQQIYNALKTIVKNNNNL